jgi:hypothetical protein
VALLLKGVLAGLLLDHQFGGTFGIPELALDFTGFASKTLDREGRAYFPTPAPRADIVHAIFDTPVNAVVPSHKSRHFAII